MAFVEDMYVVEAEVLPGDEAHRVTAPRSDLESVLRVLIDSGYERITVTKALAKEDR